MKLSMAVAYAGGFQESADQVASLEKAGLDIAWVAEAYGFDGPSYMGYLAAKTERVQIGSGILPIYTRTPALLAQTAAGVDALSEGRCILGLGASGPQVIEGFHGVAYDKPLARTREVIEVCRMAWRRERLEYRGKTVTLPLPPEQGTGLGKPLKMLTKPVRDRIPIYVAALGAKNVEMTAEIADGWLPIFYIPERAGDVWGEALAKGRANRPADLAPLEVVAGGIVAIGDDVDQDQIFDLARPTAALYIGGMGARGRNFYNDLACRYGFEAEAKEIQDLYLDGKKQEAAAKVPRELLEKTNLVGPASYVRERMAAFRESGVTALSIIPFGADPLAIVEQVKGWAEAS